MANKLNNNEAILAELKKYNHTLIPTSAQLERPILDACCVYICEKIDDALQKDKHFDVLIYATTMRWVGRYLDAIESILTTQGKQNLIIQRNNDIIRIKEKIYVRAKVVKHKKLTEGEERQIATTGDMVIFDEVDGYSGEFMCNVVVPRVLAVPDSITITTKRANNHKTFEFLKKHYEEVSRGFRCLYWLPEPVYARNDVHALDFVDLLSRHAKEFVDLFN